MSEMKIETVNMNTDRPFKDLPLEVFIAFVMAIQIEVVHRLEEVDAPKKH